MDIEALTVTTYPDYRNKLDIFFRNYPNQLVYIPPEPPLKNRIPRKDRICRFCGKGAGEVKFKHEPHIIPRLLGHNYGVSDYECDSCNLHFGTLENHFADYLGLARTVNSIGKNKVPKFISPLESLIAARTSHGANKDFVTISDKSGENFHFDPENKSWQIRYKKNPHTPINVYKCLLKIALSIMPDYELQYYQAVQEFIRGNKHTEYFRPFAKVFQMTTIFSTTTPFAILFKKNYLDDQVPMHMLYLAYQNISFQICIPFHKQDTKLNYAGIIDLVYTPPLIFSDIFESEEFHCEMLDLSSTEQLKGQDGFISFKADDSLFVDAYDTKTKQFVKKPFVPSQITKVFLSRHDGPIDFDDLNV